MRSTILLTASALCLFLRAHGASGRESEQDADRPSDAQACEYTFSGDERQITLPFTGALNVSNGGNGNIHVIGADRDDVLIQVHVQTWAGSPARADALIGQITVTTDGNQVGASGPPPASCQGWSVSYDIAMPARADLSLVTRNGNLAISSVSGTIRFSTMNGGITLTGLAGDVRGDTHNGSLTVILTGSSWAGEKLDVQTINGGVDMQFPHDYSAHLELSTRNGSLQTNYPVTQRGGNRSSGVDLSFDVGSGGALVRAVTTNGSIHLLRLD